MHLPHYAAMAAWLLGWVLLFRIPRLPRRGAGAGAGAVTVVVPARNEARTLPLLLGDLDAARPDGARVVVVDDHSEDGTAEVAQRFDFVEVRPAPPLPEGWTGKAWACHVGTADAPDGALVFLDADVRLHGDALARAVATQRARGGLLSVWPHHVVRRPYEHLSAIFNVVSFMASGAASLWRPRRPHAAFGPLLATDVDAYRRVGGHEAVRGDVIDDFALARRYTETELPVHVFGGGRDVSFRMYPDGLRSLVDGWTKNFARGALAAGPLRVLAIAFWITCAIGCLTWADGIPKPLSNVLAGLFAVQMTAFFKQVGRFSVLDGLLYPLHLLFFLVVFLRSLFRTYVLREVSWRGRRVATAAPSFRNRPPSPGARP